jgi:hypothetical protein
MTWQRHFSDAVTIKCKEARLDESRLFAFLFSRRGHATFKTRVFWHFKTRRGRRG